MKRQCGKHEQGVEMKRLILTAAGILFAGCASASTQPASEWTAGAPAVPERFEPALVARPDTEETMLTVGPGGNEIFWGVSRLWSPFSRVSTIWTARRTAEGWSAGAPAPFSIGYSDDDPFISPDGRRVYFSSARPKAPRRRDYDLYVVEKTADGWGEPRNLGDSVNSWGDELYGTVAADGTLYFGSDRSGTAWKIYRARLQPDGNYGAVEALPAPVNVPGNMNFNPFISADGRTLLFTSLNRKGDKGHGDIWLARLDAAGAVVEARNIGPVVNSAEDEAHPTLSPDGRALFFIRRLSGPDANADVYWVSTSALGLR